jgi:hypothetical protein
VIAVIAAPPADQFEQFFRGGAVAAVDGGFYSR